MYGTLTTAEAARRVGVSPMTVRSWVVRGHLRPVRPGAKPLLFVERDVIRCHAERMSATEHAWLEDAATRWRAETWQDRGQVQR